jgi:hypothetical protein
MNTTTEELYRKIQKLSESVKADLRRKGLVVPVKHKDGTIKIGSYKIIKTDQGYSILDSTDDVVQSHINLPQTAIITANKLALGQHKDTTLLLNDTKYGYAEFEEEMYKRALTSKTISNFDIQISKYGTAHIKKATYKSAITNSFQKLIKLI